LEVRSLGFIDLTGPVNTKWCRAHVLVNLHNLRRATYGVPELLIPQSRIAQHVSDHLEWLEINLARMTRCQTFKKQLTSSIGGLRIAQDNAEGQPVLVGLRG
jgi:hypothetical protein